MDNTNKMASRVKDNGKKIYLKLMKSWHWYRTDALKGWYNFCGAVNLEVFNSYFCTGKNRMRHSHFSDNEILSMPSGTQKDVKHQL